MTMTTSPQPATDDSPASTFLTADNGNGHRAQNGASLRSGGQPTLPRALGWLSIGLGVAQMVSPHRVARLVGLDGSSANLVLLRVIGAREIASGVGLLTQHDPSGWLWARIGGDALDLALLTRALGNERAGRGRMAATTAAVIGVTAVDALASVQANRGQGPAANGAMPAPAPAPRIAAAITVNAPVADVFAAWEGFRRLPEFMDSFATVSVADDSTSHWRASLPGGLSVDWDAVITDSLPNERIAWRSSEGSAMRASGDVRFRAAPGDRGTEILFEAVFAPPGGDLGSRIAGLFSDPLGVKLANDLRRCRQLIELGEIVTSDDSILKGPNPAQPVENPHPQSPSPVEPGEGAESERSRR